MLVSYNVRRCIGRDGRHDPARVASVLREMQPDIVALQELSARGHGAGAVDQAEVLAAACGLTAVPGPIVVHALGSFGNALLTRLEPRKVEHIDLGVPGREPRAALDVELACSGTQSLRVIATHLGLGLRERRTQLSRLLEHIDIGSGDPTPFVLMGDMNEWRPGPTALARLDRQLGRQRRIPTFPAQRPLLPLDRIWVRPSDALARIEAHRSARARAASDHLPLRAVLRLPPAPRASDPASPTRGRG